MTPTDYSERIVDHDGWQIRLTTYRLDGVWHTKADNVSPGACLTRTTAPTREEAESQALEKARQYVGRTRRIEV
jgi:hypothetical protein